MNIKKFIVVVYLVEMILIIMLGDGCNPKSGSSSDTIDIQDTVALTRDWEQPIPNQVTPEGLQTLRAQDCGACHIEIYNEWKRSIHAVAFQDPQFQSEWKKDDVYVCLNCHTPLQNQQEFIVTGLLDGDHKRPVKKSNDKFDEVLKYESITCATCHVRDGNVIGAMGLEGSDSIHALKVDPGLLSEQICFSCHNVSDALNPALVCTFETGDEWLKTSKKDQGFNCISCHMPVVKRSIVENGKEYESHRHHFPGSGIPKFKDMRIEGLQGLEINPEVPAEIYKVGESLDFDLFVKNSYAGHSLPTGDPERFYLIRFELKDAGDSVLQEKQYRIGEKWQWYPVAKKLADNNLPSMEERVYSFNPTLSVPGQMNLKVEVTKHRITEENADFNNLPDDYPRYITTFSETYLFRVTN